MPEDKKPFWKQEKNLWIIFIVLLVIVGVTVGRPLWQKIGGGGDVKVSSPAVPIIVTTPVEPLSRIRSQGSDSSVYQLLNQVKSSTGGVSVTSDPRLDQLQTFEVDIVVPKLGRPNPFTTF